MNITEILAEYDGMFGKSSLQDIEKFLLRSINEAKAQQDSGSVVTLLNEIIGFCRDTTQKEKALNYCEELEDLLEMMDLGGSVAYGTSLLNMANAYRAFGLFERSENLFEKTYKIYQKYLEKNDFSYASLFNNWGLLYQEMEEFEKAKELFLNALSIVDRYKEAEIEQANTRTNLAGTLLQLKTEDNYKLALTYLKEALEIFEKDGGEDFHYPAALVVSGDVYIYQEAYENAAKYYKKGMDCLERHVGRNDNYARIQEKYEYAVKMAEKATKNGCGKAFVPNLERCREFYETYGKIMIREKFPEYESRIAVGLVGEGSDCFGFDDEISMDHDYGLGFCMWLTEADYIKIGSHLEEEYNAIIRQYGEGVSKNLFLKERRGVFSINDFYNRILDTNLDYEKGQEPDFYMLEEAKLAASVNGVVFTDKPGIFTGIRQQILSYYPEELRRRKLAQALHEFSQYAQSNYGRMKTRKDAVTAGLCVAKGMESAMDIAYLLNRTYSPYYKWKRKGLEKLEKCQEILPVLEQIAGAESKGEKSFENQDIERLFDKIAGILLEELKKQDLVQGDDLFLENYVRQLLGKDREELVKQIVNLEWEQFDKVKNEGGRADCQDDFNTFSVMRKSQYNTWTRELLESFCRDLQEAGNKGWNLVMEKYARMMKSTCPDKYAQLEKELPVLSGERIEVQEAIIRIQIGWMEEFAEKYPKIANTARSIHTYEDNEYNTSYETYLRGELGTYSENTFVLYGRWIAALAQQGKNLAFEIMENTVKAYGYQSLDGAEEKICENY